MMSWSVAWSQSTVIKGRIVDAETRRQIGDALISWKIDGVSHRSHADSLGCFEIEIPQESRVLFNFSQPGYKTQAKLIVADREMIDMTILMKLSGKTLGEATVNAKARRIKQVNDTTEYYAKAYKVNQDASAYDLITQKLPGVGLRDGKLEAHGETVKEILINGKEFYKSDITLSLKNIPANIIEKIQVFDKESDYSRLTGYDDGTRRKVINLTTIDRDARRRFGKAYAGYGNDNYYKAYAMANLMERDRQISIFAQDNNISQQNFSTVDLLSQSGTAMNTAPQQSPYSKGTGNNTFHPAMSNDLSDLMVGGFSTGETKVHAIGSNYNDRLGHNGQIDLSGHYLFNKAANETHYDIRDDYFNEGANASLQAQDVATTNTNHRLNTKIDWQLGEQDHFMVRPSLLFQQKYETAGLDISEELPNEGVNFLMSQQQQTLQKALSTSNELMYIHRFDRLRASLSANVKYSYEKTHEDININLYDAANTPLSAQETVSNNETHNLAGVASYIQSLGRYFKLKADLGWNVCYRSIKRATNRLKKSEEIMRVDSALSGKTVSDYGGLISGVSLLYSRRKTNVVLGCEHHNYNLSSRNDITTAFTYAPAFLPYFTVRHIWGRRSNQFHLQYKTEQTLPSLIELQDAINNTSPTLAIRGNVNLRPATTHSAALRLLFPTRDDGGILVLFVNGETTLDYIANKRSIAGGALGAADKKSQMLSYVNADGYYATTALLAYGFPVNQIKSNVNLSSLIRYSYIPGYWESNLTHNRQLNWSGGLTIGSNISRQVDFVIDFNAQYLSDRNEQHPSTDVNYWTCSYGGQLNWQIIPSIKLVVECGRTNYFNLGTKEMDAVICNMAVAYKFLKRKQAELRLSCDDLFNQNNNFTQQTNELFRRKSNASVLKRYAMLTFTYQLD